MSLWNLAQQRSNIFTIRLSLQHPAGHASSKF
jgi:hypothetical protein